MKTVILLLASNVFMTAAQLRRRSDLAPPATPRNLPAMATPEPRDPQDRPSATLQDDPAEQEEVLPMCPV